MLTTPEIEKFSKIANQWWDISGPFKPLHYFNPIRIKAIVRIIKKHFDIKTTEYKTPFHNLTLLDMGCGGGLTSEPMARLGAHVIGIDASKEAIAIAKNHAQKNHLSITYKIGSYCCVHNMFDVILCLELIEHIENPSILIQHLSNHLKPGGIIIISTINRTVKSYLLAIIGAEYILRWIPRGTHSWKKFLTPNDLKQIFLKNKLSPSSLIGFQYQPIVQKWKQSNDYSVNYMISAINNVK